MHAFPACFDTLSVNGIHQDLRSPQASVGVEQCLESYSNVVTLYQDSYLLMSMLNLFSEGRGLCFCCREWI